MRRRPRMPFLCLLGMHDLKANSPWVLQCSRCHEVYPQTRLLGRGTASTPTTSTEEGTTSSAGGAAPGSAGSVADYFKRDEDG